MKEIFLVEVEPIEGAKFKDGFANRAKGYFTTEATKNAFLANIETEIDGDCRATVVSVPLDATIYVHTTTAADFK